MRKLQKNQVEKSIILLEEAHEQIKAAVEKNNIQAAVTILEDCQKNAISLGTLIEQTEGENAPTVSILEEYCEFVYQFYENLTAENGVSINKMYKTLRRQLIKALNSVKNDIRIRKEMVFLPYKASMWDSLESVWRAADEDSECDAYVIPIPYYDKNADGSFKTMHYEGEEYPKDVPITYYKDYDFEAHHPDVIFIHNPYDEYNLVTSVEPFFYTKNLRKYTDELVYIPYFVLGEIDAKDKEAVENISHFIKTPGVMYSHKIIVQSENIRQIYIDVLSEYAGKDTRKVWEKKISGIGSPKFDKAARTKEDEEDIPDEWKDVIYKSDGTKKKIILYNTSVGALLKHSDQYIAKMKNVFDIFRENTDNTALLWRPHPLIQATISAMRPKLWEEYEKLMTEYRNEGWGIYDDTAKLDRAIAISDAYYGDGSSVVQLCQSVGMPVMIQNVEILQERKEEKADE